MKTNLLTLLYIVLISTHGLCQTHYGLQKLSGTYSELDSPIILAEANDDWCSLPSIPIGFNFTAFNHSAQNLHLEQSCGPFFELRDSVTDYYEDEAVNIQVPVFNIFSDIGTDSVNSTISYNTYGTAPNRILKVQIKDANYSYPDNSYNFNSQLWLYETSNIIEFHLGNNIFDENDPVQRVMFIGRFGEHYNDDAFFNPHYITGNLNTPILKRYDSIESFVISPILDSILYFNNIASTNNMVFRFTPNYETSAEKFDVSTFRISPNPSSDLIHIEYKGNDIKKNLQYKIVNLQGQLIDSNKFSLENSIDISNLPDGTYLIQIYNQQKISAIKFTKR